ncbi:MAG TPA: hypothetical protein EYP47_00075, partial [Methanococcaceae archaeon]|nr:hypothetical protein [Methanococcaceae archaeon]
PYLLPKKSWKKIMARLDNHHGEEITEGNLPLAKITPKADKVPFITIHSIVNFFKTSGLEDSIYIP